MSEGNQELVNLCPAASPLLPRAWGVVLELGVPLLLQLAKWHLAASRNICSYSHILLLFQAPPPLRHSSLQRWLMHWAPRSHHCSPGERGLQATKAAVQVQLHRAGVDIAKWARAAGGKAVLFLLHHHTCIFKELKRSAPKLIPKTASKSLLTLTPFSRIKYSQKTILKTDLSKNPKLCSKPWSSGLILSKSAIP